MKKILAGVIQLDSQDDVQANLAAAEELIRGAAAQGAKLICMPESVNYVGPGIRDIAEAVPGGPTFQRFSALAKELNVWLHCGSIYAQSGEERPYNCTMVINPQGELAAHYEKLHPFDVSIGNGGPTVRESDRICPGQNIVTVDTKEVGHLGLSICYDMRFGELFRIMALEGANILLCPANFTLNTGKDHWLPLLKARAIENGCYVIAPGQIGRKPRFQAYGHSMVIDPWGNVIACASDKPCFITAEIDLDYVQTVRQQIFTLENRRSDRYILQRL